MLLANKKAYFSVKTLICGVSLADFSSKTAYKSMF
jgi:hypothetical protein